MNVLMIRSKIKAEKAADVETAAKEMFTAISEAAPQGVRYASCRLADGLTYVALLELNDGAGNPLAALPAFQKFQEGLKDWLAEPPVTEQLTPVGSYRLF
jgi:hypothetical protein